MKKFFHLTVLLSAAVSAVSFCGCTAPESILDNNIRSGSHVVIGAVLPLTGKYAVYGERMLNGLRFAEYELNNRRGISNRQVKVMAFDSAGSASGAAEAFRAAACAGAAGVIAGYSTEEFNAVAPLAKEYKIPSVVAMATASCDEDNRFIVRNAYTDKQQAEALSAYLWYWRQMLRISVLVDADPDAVYERNTARETADAFRELGGTVTCMPEYKGNDFRKALNDAVITGPQAIVIPARGARAAEMVRFLRERGYSGTVCGLDAWDDPAFFNGMDSLKQPGDCVYVSFFSPENPSGEFRDFRAGFRQKHFHEPGSCETMSYDALKMLAVGLNNARTIDDFEENWGSIRNYFGAAATYTALPDGMVDRTMFINAVEPAAYGIRSHSRLIRSFMHSKLADYRY